MKNLYIYAITLFLSVSGVFAQDTDNHWKLGACDINFTTNPPSVSNMSNPSDYGNASISDSNGNLLFYTDGARVWNKNHAVMQNGNSIGLSSSSFQPAVIIPYPNNNNKYFIISSAGESFLGKTGTNIHYSYSIVDFTNNPLGELIPTPINDSNNFNQYSRYLIASGYPIYGNGSYKPLTAAKKSNNTGYWAIVQNGKSLLSYEITSSGLNETPVVSSFNSTVINGICNYQSMFRMNQSYTKLYELETSPTGGYGKNFIEFSFNSLTGVFSNFNLISLGSSIDKFNFFELSKEDTKAYFVRDPFVAGPYTLGEIKVLDLSNTANFRTLSESGNPTNVPGNFTFLQRDKYGDVLISSYYSDLNRNKYIHKIVNNDSYANAAIQLNWVSLNNNTIGYMPQLINSIEFNPCVTNLTVAANVTSGVDKKQASSTIVASNTISSGAGAIYHAGNSVTLTNGFRAVTGSAFRAYIEGCTGTYVGKMDSENDMESNDEPIAYSSRLYPNPNNGNFTISVGQKVKGEINVAVYNTYGAQVQRSTQRLATFDIDASSLPAGLYVVKLEGNNYNETLKFIRR